MKTSASKYGTKMKTIKDISGIGDQIHENNIQSHDIKAKEYFVEFYMEIVMKYKLLLK